MRSTNNGGSKKLLDAANAETEQDLDLLLEEEEDNPEEDIDFT